MRVRRDLHVRETRPLPRSLRASEDVARSPPPTPRYDGRSFTGCTEYDWSKPWCGTTGCGICDNVGVSGGCWDECAQDGKVLTKVENELRQRSSTCFLANVSWDALEVLRGDNRCAGATDDDEWTSVLTTANPFPEGCTGQNDGCAWQVDGYAGDPDNDATCDTIYDTTACTTCDATMRPSCSVEYCLAGLDEIDDAAPTSSCSDGAEKKGGATTTAVGVIIGIVVAIVVACGCLFFFVNNSARSAPRDDYNQAQRRASRAAPAPAPAVVHYGHAQPQHAVPAVVG